MRHIVDGARLRRAARARRFAKVERTLGGLPRRQVQILRRMPRGLSGSLRLKRYLALERSEA